MAPDELHAMLQARPFIPFRVITPDGTVYEIHHPELCVVGQASLVIGYPSPGNPAIFDRYDIVSLRHGSRLEPIPPQAAEGSTQTG